MNSTPTRSVSEEDVVREWRTSESDRASSLTLRVGVNSSPLTLTSASLPSEIDSMRAVVQRVSRAKVTISGEVSGEIGPGLMVLLGVADDDGQDDAAYLAEKLVGLRAFPDDEGKMNRSIAETGGAMLIVSQFTLFGDCRKGKRPSFIKAARPEQAVELYRALVAEVRGRGITVATGRFQEHMEVELVNDGPVTLLIDSRKQF